MLAMRQACLLYQGTKFAPLAVLMTGSCGQTWDNTHLLWTTVIVRRFTLYSDTLSQIQINTKINVFTCRVAHKCISPSKIQMQGSSEYNSFTKTAWGSNNIYNHNHNWQANPQDLSTRSQFHSFSQTPTLTCFKFILLILFLVFKADILDKVSHLNSVCNLKCPILFTCQLQRSRRCNFHNSGWPV
jgi:hypothetical protein